MAFQDGAHTVEKHFSPGHWERKICWESGGRDNSTRTPSWSWPWRAAHGRASSTSWIPQKCVEQTHPEAGRKEQNHSGGARSREEGGTRPWAWGASWAGGTWRNTLASCWFWFPKAVVSLEPGECWGSGVWQQGLQLSRLWSCFWLVTETILSSVSVHKDRCLHAGAAGVPHKWNTWLLYTVGKYLAFYIFACWFIISNHSKPKALHVRVKALRDVKSHLGCGCCCLWL